MQIEGQEEASVCRSLFVVTSKSSQHILEKTKKLFEGGFLNLNLGGPCRARTYDPLIKSQLLYQLS